MRRATAVSVVLALGVSLGLVRSGDAQSGPSPVPSASEAAIPSGPNTVPSAVPPEPGQCADLRSIPSTLVSGASTTSTLRFTQAGCSVGIASVQLHVDGGPARIATFDPPLPAGSLDGGDTTTGWTGGGSFVGVSDIAGVTVTAMGTYAATAGALLRERLGSEIRQWANGATASSQYGADVWSALQATGSPDTEGYGDDVAAWAPAQQDGTTEWLALTYAQPVVPAAVNVTESDDPGFVVKVEAFDDATSAWVTLWSGTDPTPGGATGVFSPPLSPTDLVTHQIRLSIDTSVPGWNEIDAVELVGTVGPPGWLIWMHGEWQEAGAATACVGQQCSAMAWQGQPSRSWMWAFDSVTGRVGTTPDEVR